MFRERIVTNLINMGKVVHFLFNVIFGSMFSHLTGNPRVLWISDRGYLLLFVARGAAEGPGFEVCGFGLLLFLGFTIASGMATRGFWRDSGVEEMVSSLGSPLSSRDSIRSEELVSPMGVTSLSGNVLCRPVEAVKEEEKVMCVPRR